MEPLGRFLEYSMESLESILKAPLGQTFNILPRDSIENSRKPP